MTDPLAFTLALNISVQYLAPVIEAAARKIFRRRHNASVVEARILLAGDVPKALAVLIALDELASATAMVLWIQSGSGDPVLSGTGLAMPTVLARPGA
jgi:hypothetical protein